MLVNKNQEVIEMFAEIFIQMIGFVGMGFAILSYQLNKHRAIMVCKSLSEGIFALQFFLLASYTGLAMNALGIIRNLTFAKLVQKNKTTTPFIVLFTALLIGTGILTWAGPLSLLAVTGKTFTTFAFGMKSPKNVRLFTIPSCITWLTYDLLTGTIAGVATEVFGMISIFIAYLRFDKDYTKTPKIKRFNHAHS